MRSAEFNEAVERQIELCRSMLIKKASEYADESNDNRLHNFHQAAHLQKITLHEALGGMMAKHTVSVYDMIDSSHGHIQDLALWEEKITDHINYLLILKAIVVNDYQDYLVEHDLDKLPAVSDMDVGKLGYSEHDGIRQDRRPILGRFVEAFEKLNTSVGEMERRGFNPPDPQKKHVL